MGFGSGAAGRKALAEQLVGFSPSRSLVSLTRKPVVACIDLQPHRGNLILSNPSIFRRIVSVCPEVPSLSPTVSACIDMVGAVVASLGAHAHQCPATPLATLLRRQPSGRVGGDVPELVVITRIDLR